MRGKEAPSLYRAAQPRTQGHPAGEGLVLPPALRFAHPKPRAFAILRLALQRRHPRASTSCPRETEDLTPALTLLPPDKQVTSTFAAHLLSGAISGDDDGQMWYLWCEDALSFQLQLSPGSFILRNNPLESKKCWTLPSPGDTQPLPQTHETALFVRTSSGHKG